MGFEDDIKKQKQKIEADMRAEEERKRVKKIFDDNGFSKSSPIVMAPPPLLQPVISEAMQHVKFTEPKIVRAMPDCTARVRPTRNKRNNRPEKADAFSYDVIIDSKTEDKSTHNYWMIILSDGNVAFSDGGLHSNWNLNVDSNWVGIIRQRIIDDIAAKTMKTTNKSNASSGSGKSSKGCYIATAVYGSYDCPEVWVLRRLRDDILCGSRIGRAFVKGYYRMSPALVKHFGHTNWFVRFWRNSLDNMVNKLRGRGVSDAAYDDRL